MGTVVHAVIYRNDQRIPVGNQTQSKRRSGPPSADEIPPFR